jgi:phosphate/sulfate permease
MFLYLKQIIILYSGFIINASSGFILLLSSFFGFPVSAKHLIASSLYIIKKREAVEENVKKIHYHTPFKRIMYVLIMILVSTITPLLWTLLMLKISGIGTEI